MQNIISVTVLNLTWILSYLLVILSCLDIWFKRNHCGPNIHKKDGIFKFFSTLKTIENINKKKLFAAVQNNHNR